MFQNVDQNMAVLIKVTRIGTKQFPPGHWAIVVGYSDRGARLLVLDPDNGSPNGIWLSANDVASGLKYGRYVA